MEKSNIYIGEIIRNVMADNQVTKAELARRLGVRPQSVDYMLTRKSIDTDTLYNVSRALNYDFAMLYSLREGQTNCDVKQQTISTHQKVFFSNSTLLDLPVSILTPLYKF